ncbi:MAG TPA: cation transporter [Burkholderiales bacterium]|nr:cation transporter [Burkholderiales bacterium]
MAEDYCNTTIIVANERYRRVLWIALGINAVMFVVEIAGGFISGSVSLLADAIDFLGDAANYGLSLAVFSLGMMWRARSALLKGLCMGGYGVFVMARAGWAALYGEPPEPFIMGAVAVVALFANLGVAAMLFAYRQGDSDMRSVWLCSRNDAINNIAVIIAAIIVFGTASKWPDLAVAAVMGILGLTSSAAVIRHALADMRSVRA